MVPDSNDGTGRVVVCSYWIVESQHRDHQGLRDCGFVVERIGTSDDYTVRATGGDVSAHEPVLSLPPALLAEYLEQMSRELPDAPDPLAEAVEITTVHLAEELGIYHHGEPVHTRSAGLRRRRDGRLVLLLDQDIPGVPYQAPDEDLEWRAY